MEWRLASPPSTSDEFNEIMEAGGGAHPATEFTGAASKTARERLEMF